MNYIKLINDFWTMNEIHAFNSNEMALYFYLLRVNNLCSWKASFNHNNQKILATIGVSFNTFKGARNKLKQAGLIDFRTKNGSPTVTYSLTTLSNFDKVTDEVTAEVTNEVASSKDKLNKTKQKSSPQNEISSVRAKLEIFRNALAPFLATYGENTVKDFYNYWTELNPSGKKMKFEMERTWEFGKRLGTWKRNEERFGAKTFPKKSEDNTELSRAEKAEQKKRAKQ